MWRGGRNTSLGSENELGEKYQWLDSWMATKPWDSRGRTSTDQSDYVKTVEIYDSLQPYSYLAPNYRMSSAQHQQRPSYPLHRPGAAHQMYSPVTPSPSKQDLKSTLQVLIVQDKKKAITWLKLQAQGQITIISLRAQHLQGVQCLITWPQLSLPSQGSGIRAHQDRGSQRQRGKAREQKSAYRTLSLSLTPSITI